MLVRRIPALLTALALAASGLTLASSPTTASIVSGSATVSPSIWEPSTTQEVVVQWTESVASSSIARPTSPWTDNTSTTGPYLSVEVGWGWALTSANPANDPPDRYDAVWNSGTKSFVCATSPAITFSSPGFSLNGAGPLDCLIRRASYPQSSSDPGQQVILSNTGTSNFVLAASSTVSVTFASGQVTSPSARPSTDSWRIISLTGNQTTTVRTYVPGLDGGVSDEPTQITINIDGNGGTCRTTTVTGFQGSWANAPDSGCIKPGYILSGFNTKPDGSGLAIGLGGNLNLTTDNTLYAIYEQFRTAGAPLDVVATPGRNTISLSWKPPVNQGTFGISNYLATATPSGRVCITRRTDANMLACEIKMPATNTKYTFKVQALNPAGWGPYSAESSPVSPYDAVILEVARTKNGLFQGLGSTLRFDGRAPGFAQGTVVTPQLRVGPNGDWASETKDRPKVDANGRVVWSKRLGISLNKKWVEVRFLVGGIESNQFKLDVGSNFGKLTAPRNVSVKSTINGLEVSWKAPAFDGGSKVTSYKVTSSDGLGYECEVTAPSTECTMRARAFNFNPQQTYTFSVVAKNADGVSEAGTATWKGKLYNLRITSGTRGPNAGKESIGINAFSSGFKVGEKFTVETRVGKNGTWTKQSKAMVLEEDGRGSWERIIGPDLASQDVYVRIVTSRGISNELRLRPLR